MNTDKNKTKETIEKPKGFGNLPSWVVVTAFLAFVWSLMAIYMLDLFGVVSTVRGRHGRPPELYHLFMFCFLSYFVYRQRYTLPSDVYHYQENESKDRVLSFREHVIAYIITVIIISPFMWLEWSSTTFT
jgi:hypothetical protein